MPFIIQEDKEDYLLFLKSLLKGKVYVELAYMTGCCRLLETMLRMVLRNLLIPSLTCRVKACKQSFLRTRHTPAVRN